MSGGPRNSPTVTDLGVLNAADFKELQRLGANCSETSGIFLVVVANEVLDQR